MVVTNRHLKGLKGPDHFVLAGRVPDSFLSGKMAVSIYRLSKEKMVNA
jgi:hypothetical protein